MLTPEALAEIRTKHPEAEVLDTDGQPELSVVVRPPTSQEWKAAKSMLFEKESRADSNRMLVNACLLFPAADAFSALANRYPAWVDDVAEAVGIMGGSKFKVAIRKR